MSCLADAYRALPRPVLFSFSVSDSVRNKMLGGGREKEAAPPLGVVCCGLPGGRWWTQLSGAGGQVAGFRDSLEEELFVPGPALRLRTQASGALSARAIGQSGTSAVTLSSFSSVGSPRSCDHGGSQTSTSWIPDSPDSDELALERMCWESLMLVTHGPRSGERQVEGRQALAL